MYSLKTDYVTNLTSNMTKHSLPKLSSDTHQFFNKNQVNSQQDDDEWWTPQEGSKCPLKQQKQ